MSKGYLIAQLFTARQARPITNATVTISRPGGDTIIRTVAVDREGKTEPIEVDTPPRALSLDENYAGIPYGTYDVTIRALNFATFRIQKVQVFEAETTIQPVELVPFDREDYDSNAGFSVDTPVHLLAQPEPVRRTPPVQAMPQVLQSVIIPSQLVVHLGPPQSYAENVYISFPDYIKNVCSSEIYPTWPEEAIRANIYAQISLALNRVYTEWYPSQGYDFQITNSTQYDQKFIKGRNIFENISRIVDDVFNVYVSRIGSRGPFFTEYCDGRQVSCPGMKQWETVELAEQGYSPLEILRYSYGDDIELVETNNIQDIPQSYPGTPLRRGSTGIYVQILQTKLQRIAQNYPMISNISVDGVYGAATEQAVKTFQGIFNLAQDGVVGKATWYKISYIYVAVTKLAELGAENENLPANAGSYPGNVLREGSTGVGVSIVQFYLNTVNLFYQTVPAVDIDGLYGPATADAVRRFQRQFNLPADGIVGKETWNKLYKVYLELVAQLPGATLSCSSYPGAPLQSGDFGRDVSTLQAWLSYIADYDAAIPKLASDGIFGAKTRDAVLAFQRQYGLEPGGVVGQETWSRLCQVSTQIATGGASNEYPGSPLRVGSSGAAVQKMQRYLNYIGNTNPTIPRMVADGIFGTNTRDAVLAFQRLYSLPADGIIGRQTWDKIVQVYNGLRVQATQAAQTQPRTAGGQPEMADLPVSAMQVRRQTPDAPADFPGGEKAAPVDRPQRPSGKIQPASTEPADSRKFWRDDPLLEASLFDQDHPMGSKD